MFMKNAAHYVQEVSKSSEMGKISFLPFVKENLNRHSKANAEILRNIENSCAQAVSKISGMLGHLRRLCAEWLSNMSKKTKM
jgi:hypothetical protein